MFEWNDEEIQTSCEQVDHEVELVHDTFAALEQIELDIARDKGITREVAIRLIGVAPSMEGMSEKAFSSYPSDVNLDVALEGFVETFFGGIVTVFETIFKVIFKMLDLMMRPIYWLFGYDPDGSSSSSGGGGSGGGASDGGKLNKAGTEVKKLQEQYSEFESKILADAKEFNKLIAEENSDGRYSFTKLGLALRDVSGDKDMFKDFTENLDYSSNMQAKYIHMLDTMVEGLADLEDDPFNQDGSGELLSKQAIKRPDEMRKRIRSWYDSSFAPLAKLFGAEMHASVSEDYDPARLAEVCGKARAHVKTLASEKTDQTLTVEDVIAILNVTPKVYYTADKNGEAVAKEIAKNSKEAQKVKKDFKPTKSFKVTADGNAPEEARARARFDTLKKSVLEINKVGNSMMRCITEYSHIVPYVVAQRLEMVKLAGKALHLLDKDGKLKEQK